jgi:hypothetical protein
MKGMRRHIAVYLAGIFIFPVLFQPWHIIHHHGHECPDHHEKGDPCHTKPVPGFTILNQIPGHDHCYVCDFKFPVNDLPNSFNIYTVPHIYQEVQSGLPLSHLPESEQSEFNPRAPPFL